MEYAINEKTMTKQYLEFFNGAGEPLGEQDFLRSKNVRLTPLN